MTTEQIKIYRAMTLARKLELAAEFHTASRELKTRALLAQHPDWPAEKVHKRVRELFLYATD